jgi:hypothetical protein
MKNILYIILILFTLSACNDNKDEAEEKTKIPPELIGTWLNYEEYASDGAHEGWKTIPEQFRYNYEFSNDYKVRHFTSGDAGITGEFSVTENNLIAFYFNGSRDTVRIDTLTNEILILDFDAIEPL